MGIEHRLKEDEQEFWQCPECDAVFRDEKLEKEQICPECEEKVQPSSNQVYWEEFSEYCRRLKDGF